MRRAPRKLRVSTSGKWYLALTVGIGVVSLVSGNNVLYLIESLMLSALILSGVLSERSVSGVRVTIQRGQAIAAQACPDWIEIKNETGQPLFCVEISEWRGRKFEPIAFAPRIAEKSTVRIRSSQIIATRGEHKWDGFAIATRYPFGFAQKIKPVSMPGVRIVWPENLAVQKKLHLSDQGQQRGRNSRSQDISDGELRPFTHDDDSRLIVWTASSKGAGPMVRPRGQSGIDPEARLDVRGLNLAELEAEIKRTARVFYVAPPKEEGGRLTIIGKAGKNRYFGRRRVLTKLATLQGRAA